MTQQALHQAQVGAGAGEQHGVGVAGGVKGDGLPAGQVLIGKRGAVGAAAHDRLVQAGQPAGAQPLVGLLVVAAVVLGRHEKVGVGVEPLVVADDVEHLPAQGNDGGGAGAGLEGQVVQVHLPLRRGPQLRAQGQVQVGVAQARAGRHQPAVAGQAQRGRAVEPGQQLQLAGRGVEDVGQLGRQRLDEGAQQQHPLLAGLAAQLVGVAQGDVLQGPAQLAQGVVHRVVAGPGELEEPLAQAQQQRRIDLGLGQLLGSHQAQVLGRQAVAFGEGFDAGGQALVALGGVGRLEAALVVGPPAQGQRQGQAQHRGRHLRRPRVQGPAQGFPGQPLGRERQLLDGLFQGRAQGQQAAVHFRHQHRLGRARRAEAGQLARLVPLAGPQPHAGHGEAHFNGPPGHDEGPQRAAAQVGGAGVESKVKSSHCVAKVRIKVIREGVLDKRRAGRGQLAWVLDENPRPP